MQYYLLLYRVMQTNPVLSQVVITTRQLQTPSNRDLEITWLNQYENWILGNNKEEQIKNIYYS